MVQQYNQLAVSWVEYSTAKKCIANKLHSSGQTDSVWTFRLKIEGDYLTTFANLRAKIVWRLATFYQAASAISLQSKRPPQLLIGCEITTPPPSKPSHNEVAILF